MQTCTWNIKIKFKKLNIYCFDSHFKNQVNTKMLTHFFKGMQAIHMYYYYLSE